MSREYRRSADDVNSRRIDMAAVRAARPIDGPASGSRALALLGITDDGGERQDGRRAVARYVRDSHGCDGAVLGELLDALGLGGER